MQRKNYFFFIPGWLESSYFAEVKINYLGSVYISESAADLGLAYFLHAVFYLLYFGSIYPPPCTVKARWPPP